MKTAAFLSPGGDLAAGVDLARRADAIGYDSVWVTHGGGRDSFLVLAAYGAVTSRARLGVGVLPIYPRHPIATAQAALTLSEQTAGRYILGLGVSHRASMEQQLGLRLADPLGVMREYVDVLRGAFGDGARFDGKHYRVQWSMALPGRLPAPPIYLAALSAKMLELAGEIADGVVLWLCNPNYIRDVVVPTVAEGRAKAGRDPDGFDIVAAVPSAVTDDPEAARERLRGELVPYFGLPYYRAMLERSGLDPDAGPTDEFLNLLGAIGSAGEARESVRRYAESGTSSPCVGGIAGTDFDATLDALAGSLD
jgi:F420-dependent oxidoreductase-like protein